MKAFILILIALLISACLPGCATTTTSITLPDTGQVFEMKTRTLFKDVKDVTGNASREGFMFNLGSSASTLTPDQAAALRCLQNPVLCK